MKIGYAMLAHKDPEQVWRLIGSLDSPDSYFSVHLDRKMKGKDSSRIRSLLAGKKNVFFVGHPVRVYWGTMTVVVATLLAVDCLRDNVAGVDFIILLSGEHYPLKSPLEIARFLDKNKDKIFMKYNRLPDMKNWPQTRGGLIRLHPRFFFIAGRPFDYGYAKWLFAETLRRLRLVKPQSPKPDSFYLKEFPAGYVPYGGSQWWLLPISALDYIQSEMRRRPGIVSYFSRTFIPDESFFHTIIMNGPFKDSVVSDNLNFIKWIKNGDAHPCYPALADLDAIVSSGAFFARKFGSSTNADLQDAIDAIIKSHEFKLYE